MVGSTNVATGEVTTLEHELGDDAVELGGLVAKALLAGRKSAEVLDGLGDDVVVEVEVDATGLLLNGTLAGDPSGVVNLDLGAPVVRGLAV